MAESQSNENTCVVCFKNVLYYSIGECDHPVCFECSTRMRVLCLQNECPICRQDLSRVVFTNTIETYKELRNRVFSDRLFERQFKIAFSNEEIKSAYELLLENRCKLCEKAPPFRHFSMLNDHMRKSHERYFCELCVKHLKIFTSERKTYTRQELAHHRRKGDLDDTSHRGHPLCEFCEERFMDADELYRHLRKEHLYCHLCDADGRNLYYASHSALAHHFRTDHYLCEDGDCAGQHLTAVFRSEIDLKAHKATVHGRNLTRGAARQARTLELQFNITPHPVAQRAPRERERERDREREREETARAPSPPAVEAARIDTRSDQQFPRLSPATPATNLMLTPSLRGYKGGDGLTRNNKNFPELGGGGASSGRPASAASATTATATTVAATVLKNSKPSVSIQLQSQPTSASNFRLTQTSGNNRISLPPQQKKQPPLFEDDFPSLSVGKDDYPSIGAATMQQPKVTMINSQEMQSLKNNQSSSRQRKPHLNAEAFPALSSTTTPTAPPQWITVSKPKEKQKSAKPELKKTTPREPVFNPVADFPTLPVNHKTKNKKTQPQPQPQPAVQNEVKLSKKEKKKQNNKKENLLETNYLNGGSDKMNKDMYENMGSNPTTEVGKKIKTVEAPAPAPVVAEKNRNGGNGDFSLSDKDYPPLNPRSVNTMPMRAVPQYSVPPGFGPRPACDGLVFINSSGQTFSAPVHSYIHPPDFELRNRALVKYFAIALGSTAAVDVFKESSRAFRDSTISAADFYDQCRSTLDTQFDDVFPDLVALLPDIAKQQELVAGRDIRAYLEVCPTCGQLVTPGDRLVHDTAHWPPLAPR